MSNVEWDAKHIQLERRKTVTMEDGVFGYGMEGDGSLDENELESLGCSSNGLIEDGSWYENENGSLGGDEDGSLICSSGSLDGNGDGTFDGNEDEMFERRFN